MGTFRLRNIVCYLFTLVLPAATFAATQPFCKGGAPTPESYKWNFSKEAEGLLKQFKQDAYNDKVAANYLESYSSDWTDITWQVDASQLTKVKHWDNKMDKILCRLRTIERALPPYEQAEINALAPPVAEVTDTTQNAILFLNGHHIQLFLPHYQGDVTDIYNEASRAAAASAHPREYLEANYRNNPSAAPQGMKTSS